MMVTDPLYQEDGWMAHNLDSRPDTVSQKGLVALIFYLLHFCRPQVSAKRANYISYLFLRFWPRYNFILSVFLQ